MSKEKVVCRASDKSPVTIAAKVAEAIEVTSDINFDDGYKPSNALFCGLSALWNRENGSVVIEFEDGQRFELLVRKMK